MSGRHPHMCWGRVARHRRAAVVELLRSMADDVRTGSDNEAHCAVARDLHAAADLLDLAGPARRRVEQREQARPRVTVRQLLEESDGWWYSVEVAHETGLSIGSATAQLRKLWRAGLLESELRPSPSSTLKRRYFHWLAAQEAAE